MSTRYLKVAPPSAAKPILKSARGLSSRASHLTSHSFKSWCLTATPPKLKDPLGASLHQQNLKLDYTGWDETSHFISDHHQNDETRPRCAFRHIGSV